MEVDPTAERIGCTEADAQELLASLALWAECNSVCLKIPRPIFEEIEAS
jgi:hypothetical protein